MNERGIDHNSPARGLAEQIRHGLDAGKPAAYQGAALPKILRGLATNTAAAHAHEDPRTTAELLAAVHSGDRDAETALYVRVAPELDRVAARAVGSSALDREDLHQIGAERLIADARNGKLAETFGGNIGSYIGVALLGEMRDEAGKQSPGKPNDPTRLAQKLRLALRATTDPDGEYNLIAAAAYVRARWQWTLGTFWSVYGQMFNSSNDFHTATGAGYTLAETLADDGAAAALDQVETAEIVRDLRNRAGLSARQRDVLNQVFGFDGPALSDTEAARTLGISQQRVSKIKNDAIRALRAVCGAAETSDGTTEGDARCRGSRSRTAA